jgi:Tol biopolymer transport system component
MKRLSVVLTLFLALTLIIGVIGCDGKKEYPLTTGKIAFTSYRNGNYPEIWIMNADASNQTRLTNGNDISSGHNDFSPALSPDGTKIAFVSTRDQNGGEEIYLMHADGSNVVRLTNNAYSDRNPAWSPDGAQIAFYSNRDSIGNIFIMSVDGSNQTRLTVNGGDKPTWSPDGTKIAFVSSRDSNAYSPIDNVFVINIGGSDEIRITNEQPGYIYGISWSPVSSRIVYDSIVPYNPTPGVPDYYSRGLFVINADGTGRTALPVTGALKNACVPVWSPDGFKIAFSTTRYQPQEIYTVNADGSGLVQLTNTDNTPGLERGNYEPSWGQDSPLTSI